MDSYETYCQDDIESPNSSSRNLNCTTFEDSYFCNSYGDWGSHVIVNNERSILLDLKPYAFTDDIKNQADIIYNKMYHRVRRGKIRFQMLFFCVYCAHLELGRDVNPLELGSKFGLTPGEIQRCDSLFSPLQTGYRPPPTNTTPLRYIPEYCEKLGLSSETTADVIRMAKTLLQKDPSLLQDHPVSIAAGTVKYYTVIHGINIEDPQLLSQITSRSFVTIDQIYKRIAIIDNN